MAGAYTEFFTQKVNEHQAVVEAGKAAEQKLAAANQALVLLKQPTLTAAEAEALFSLQTAAQ